jgi:hypothetical protein
LMQRSHGCAEYMTTTCRCWSYPTGRRGTRVLRDALPTDLHQCLLRAGQLAQRKRVGGHRRHAREQLHHTASVPSVHAAVIVLQRKDVSCGAVHANAARRFAAAHAQRGLTAMRCTRTSAGAHEDAESMRTIVCLSVVPTACACLPSGPRIRAESLARPPTAARSARARASTAAAIMTRGTLHNPWPVAHCTSACFRQQYPASSGCSGWETM